MNLSLLHASEVHSLVDKTLVPMHFLNILGDKRATYLNDNYNLELAYQFHSGTLDPRKVESVFANMLGLEFNLYALERLEELGCLNIQSEVPAGGTEVDAAAYFKGIERFQIILPDMREVFCFVPKGYGSIEAKCQRKLKGKAAKQISKARGYFDHSHALVLADTKVTPQICKRIYEEGGDIIRSHATRQDMVNRVLNIQRQMRVYH